MEEEKDSNPQNQEENQEEKGDEVIQSPETDSNDCSLSKPNEDEPIQTGNLESATSSFANALIYAQDDHTEAPQSGDPNEVCPHEDKELAEEEEIKRDENNNNNNNGENSPNDDNDQNGIKPDSDEAVLETTSAEIAESLLDPDQPQNLQGTTEQPASKDGEEESDIFLPPIQNLKTYEELQQQLEQEQESSNFPVSKAKKTQQSQQSQHQPNLPVVKPQKPRIFPNTARTPYQRLPPPPTEISPQMQKLMDRAIAGENLAGLSIETYDELIVNLQQSRKQVASQHRYRDGHKINDAIKRIEQYKVDIQKSKLKKQATEEYQDTLTSFKTQCDEYDAQTKDNLKKLEENQVKKREDLQEAHKNQLFEHQQHWTSPLKYRLYNRASNALTDLRRKHSLLLVQCRFDEAEVINKEIMAKTQEEEQANHAMYQRAYEESLLLLQQKQKEEDEFLENKCAIEVASTVQRRARERRALENKQKKIESRADVVNDPEKLWNLMQMQRIEDLSTQNSSRAFMPSSKLKRKDIGDRDVAILTLPPLQLKTPVVGTRKSSK